MSESKKPVYLARAKSGDDDYMHTIGAAWPFKEGKDGYVVKIHSIPINWNGEFILSPPKD